MTSKKRTLTAVIGLALGAAIFSGAAMADLPTSNGYEIGKKAVKGLLNNENYTMNANIKLSIDDELLNSIEITELYDRNGDVVLNRTEKNEASDKYPHYTSVAEYKSYKQDGDYISIYRNENGEEHSSIYEDANYMGQGSCDSLSNVKDNDKETTEKIIRVVELLGDTLVGDLKNNIVYVSGDDNSSTYEINLDTMQIPEIVNAGLSAMFSSINESNDYLDEEYKDPFCILGKDPVVKNASLKFTVDSEGRAAFANAIATVAGNGHEGSVEMTFAMSDYGTTKPERIDTSTLKNAEYLNTRENTDSSYLVTDSPEKIDIQVNDDGEVVDNDGNVVGHIEIDPKTSEGHVVIDGADGPTSVIVAP